MISKSLLGDIAASITFKMATNDVNSRLAGIFLGLVAALFLYFPAPGWSAEDAGQRARDANQLQRQQQQDQLQLRMQQYQSRVQNPPTDVRSRQALEQLEISQQLRQQQLHQQQQRDVQVQRDPPSDDDGTRRAKAQIEQQRAAAESRRQLQQFDWELQNRADGVRKEEVNPLPGAVSPLPGQHVPQ